MHAEVLKAPVVEDRDHDIAVLRQRPADLDLPVLSIKATAHSLKIRRDRVGQPAASSERTRNSL
jgi:hypothetical protein